MAQVKIEKHTIIVSVKPPYARMLLEGSKTIELRRRFSTNIPPNTRVLIYATDPVKKILGECQIKKILKLPVEDLWRASCRDAMISWGTFKSYFSDLKEGYGIVLHKQQVYKQPITLEHMRTKYGITPPQSYRSVNVGL